MAHYAFIKDNIVERVIVGPDEDDTTNLPSEFSSWEEYFEDKKSGYTVKRTSYNTEGGQHKNGGTALRANYAGVGMTYDSVNDIFHETKVDENASWTVNTTTGALEPPIDMPDDGNEYTWSESTYQADTSDPKTQGWIQVT